MTKNFEVAAEAEAYPQEWIEFEVDGHPCRAMSEPGGGQVAYLMARAAKHISEQEKIGAMLNFFDSSLDDATQVHLSRRMLDPEDKFGPEHIQQIIVWLMEEWSGRPTRRSSGSMPPPPPTGPGLTAPAPMST